MLPLVEDFYTLQGEGAQTGRAAWFVRLAGCDVGCRWCDAKETWNPRTHTLTGVEEIVRRVSEGAARTVVVTGGEPLMWQLDELCEKLHGAGMEVFLETSGSHPFSGAFDWVCLSPKKQRPPLDEAWARADEIKVVVESEEDLRWAEECASKITNYELRVTSEACETVKCQLFLQPEWSRRDEMMPVLVEYIKANPRWRMSLQTHKYMRIP